MHDKHVNAESEDSQDESNPSPHQHQHATVEIGIEVERILGLEELQRLSSASALVPVPSNSTPKTSPSSSSDGQNAPQGWSFGSKHFPDLKVTLVTSKSKVSQIS